MNAFSGVPVALRAERKSGTRSEQLITGTARDANIGANAPTVLRARIIETSGGGTRTETFLRRVSGAVSAGVR